MNEDFFPTRDIIRNVSKMGLKRLHHGVHDTKAWQMEFSKCSGLIKLFNLVLDFLFSKVDLLAIGEEI